jgi:alkanesulfonate monooxygenase SsuD/methylene tetrahydromethanopterin reductase-like flavin-dependent oxidoreductase (luciferase family)
MRIKHIDSPSVTLTPAPAIRGWWGLAGEPGASELRTRAAEILVRATNTADQEVQEMMRVVAAGYEKLARRPSNAFARQTRCRAFANARDRGV